MRGFAGPEVAILGSAMKLTDDLRRLGLKIKSSRVHAGLRQIEVNEQTGLTYGHYQNIEAGKVNVTLETLHRLSVLHEVSIEDLVKSPQL